MSGCPMDEGMHIIGTELARTWRGAQEAKAAMFGMQIIVIESFEHGHVQTFAKPEHEAEA